MNAGRIILLSIALFAGFIGLERPLYAEVGIDEQLGDILPSDLQFIDESGGRVTTGGLINGPTVFSLVYLGCRKMCPLLLSGEAGVISELKQMPGDGYNLVTVSFDEYDTPKDAAEARDKYISMAGLPAGANWRFLTGDRENIKRLTDAFGFRFERTGDGFSHVAALVVVSPKSKIVRYIYGIKFLPFDLKMALTEAETETSGLSARRAILYCFRFDPEGNKYVLDILKIFATVSIISAIILFTYLVRSSRRRREEMGDDVDE